MKAMSNRLRAGWESCAIGLAVFLFHLCHVPAVARSAIFRRDNMAFDFDIGRFVSLWGDTMFQSAANPAYYAVRHPLAVLVRPFAAPLAAAGIEAPIVAGTVAALCAALSSVLAFRMARALGIDRAPAHILTAMWTFSATPLLLGVLPEAYGLALVALAWQMLLALRWAQGRQPAWPVRITAAVANFGITITNVILSGLVELVCRLAHQPARKAIAATAGFSAAATAIALVLSAASFQIWPVEGVDGSQGAAKQIYWSASSPTTNDVSRQSPFEVAWTFGATAFVAPSVAAYPAGGQADPPYLYDLRGRDHGVAGWIALSGWLALLLLGTVAAVRDRALRPFWIIAASWIAGNVALHSYWQFREVVFLYTAHAAIAIFALVLAGARWVQGRHRHGALAYAAAAGLVTLFLILNNMGLYLALPLLR